MEKNKYRQSRDKKDMGSFTHSPTYNILPHLLCCAFSL